MKKLIVGREGKKMRVLAIGPHPDDIEIGCAGTLLRLARAGHEIYLALLTGGEAGGDKGRRRTEQEAVAKLYRTRKVFWLGHQDTRIPLTRESIDGLDRVMREVKADLVFANYAQDTHQDHRNTASLVLSATRYTQNVLFYEVPTSVDFHPDVFVDIGQVLGQKYRALRLHKSQVNKVNVADLSIIDCARSMAHFRGFQGRVKAAEGFKALRLLIQP
jgi:LmbE family N-acetylglucosaminyl deacetylase